MDRMMQIFCVERIIVQCGKEKEIMIKRSFIFVNWKT